MSSDKSLNKKKTIKKYMNKNDKRILNALEFLSKNTRKEIKDMKKYYKPNKCDYDLFVSKDIEKILLKKGYMSFKDKDLFDKGFLITEKGNEHKHKLQEIRFRDYKKLVLLLTAISILLNIWLIGDKVGWW